MRRRVEKLKSAEFIRKENNHLGDYKLLQNDVQWNHPEGGKQRCWTDVRDYQRAVIRKITVYEGEDNVPFEVVVVFAWSHPSSTVEIEVFPYGRADKPRPFLIGSKLMDVGFFPELDMKYRIPKFFQLKEQTKVSRLADIVEAHIRKYLFNQSVKGVNNE